MFGANTKKELTGRTVLFSLIAFFGVVSAVNGIMITAAVKTFGGVETESSYKAGLAFAREMAAADAQAARHWQVQADVVPAGPEARIEVTARDAAGQPLRDVTALVRLVHPTDRRLDQIVDMTAQEPGRFLGTTAHVAGQWDIVIDLDRGNDRMFRSRNRVILK
jgi:nitrogen fixation protein FixH